MDCVGKMEVMVDESIGDTDQGDTQCSSEDEVTYVNNNCASTSKEDHTYCRCTKRVHNGNRWHDDSYEEPLYNIRERNTENCHVDNDANRKQATSFSDGKPVKLPNVFVRSDKTWRFQKETVVATCGEDGQFFYHPDPFSPAPPFKGAPSAVKRMQYAAQRIDNRKYRGQRDKVLASDEMDSATCSKCHLRFFLPFRHFKNRITYAVAHFCPLTNPTDSH
ncbi:unnamed protein product [Cylicocyclus nassatus]|uniref:Uncharacterized protein n=1 Tax=Cylicocyclus nassatus TaxID=53992 RepID=A0AA36GXN4_CYLNA|nr:unnamed protein product [Cylicocyclus nassatus]